MEISSNGGVIIDLSAPGFGDSYFAFSANQNALGGATGHFHQRRVRNGLVVDLAGDVTCLSVDPVRMRARIGGVITENNSTDPAFLTTNHELVTTCGGIRIPFSH